MLETMSYRDELSSIWSDLYKDVNGFRPRYTDISNWSEQDFQSEINSLSLELDVIIKQEAERDKIMASQFEKVVSDVINSGAGNRETALRWLMDASEADGDWDYFCYLNELPYGYVK